MGCKDKASALKNAAGTVRIFLKKRKKIKIESELRQTLIRLTAKTGSLKGIRVFADQKDPKGKTEK